MQPSARRASATTPPRWPPTALGMTANSRFFVMIKGNFHSQFIFRALAVAAALSVAACAGGDDGPQPPQLGLSCVDDSANCISQRERVFNSYMADKSRTWVKQPVTPEGYASGVRLFALSKRRKELSCEELLHGKREADGASGALRGPGGKNLTPAQISRGVMLAGDVSRELSREHQRRCRRA